MQITGEPPLVIIDYLQDLNRSDVQHVRQGVAEVSRRIRRIATKHAVAILVLSSTSRMNHLKSGVPISLEPNDYMTSAKESGNTEYDASTVMFLLTLPRTDPETRYRDAALLIAKTRGGSTGIVGMRLDTKTTRWTEDPSALDRIAQVSKAADEGKKADQIDLMLGLIRTGTRTTDGTRAPMTRMLLRGCRGLNRNSFAVNLATLIRNKRVKELDLPKGGLETVDVIAPAN
jgi:hypothetical protein